jgi:DNA-binding GntR family transcriptional regulator
MVSAEVEERTKAQVGDDSFHGLARSVCGMPPAQSASQRAYDLILQGIMTGVLASGRRLPEVPLAQSLGLGRTPVREALMRLETDGFVVSEPRVGMVVAGNTIRSMAEIYEVMEVLEGFSGRLAARFAGASDIAAMRALLQEAEEPTRTGHVPALRLLNYRFHRLIHLATRNDQLARELGRLLNLVSLSPSTIYAEAGRAEQAMTEHRAILEAIINRDDELAARLSEEHKRRDKESRLAQMLANGIS